MKAVRWTSYFFVIILFISCNPEIDDPPVDNLPAFHNFSFFRQHNPGLILDVTLEEEDGIFTGELPQGARISEMVAMYELKEGYEAYVDGVFQLPGESVNDFSIPVEYLVVGPEADSSMYTIDVDFSTILPIIHLYTLNDQAIVSKEDYIEATIILEGNDLFEDIDATPIKIRGRGNSTWGLHPKKPYQIKFDEKTPVLGMPGDKRWLLLAEYSDKTCLRNSLAFEMGYKSELDWTPLGEFADVYLNGEYNGLYHITQKVEETPNRVDISNDGFLLEIDHPDRLDPDDVFFHSDHFLINIKEPELSAHGLESAYIEKYIEEFEDALFGPYFKLPDVGYRKYIDMESVVDWFLINEIAKNVDAKNFSSIFFHKAPGGKIKMGPLWDFDLAYGNVNYADTQFPERWWVKENAWISRMLQDPAFVALVKERYAYFREHQEYFYDFLDQKAKYISRSMEEDDDKWHTIGKYVWPNPVVYTSYEQELEYLKQWLNDRLMWMDGAVQQL